MRRVPLLAALLEAADLRFVVVRDVRNRRPVALHHAADVMLDLADGALLDRAVDGKIVGGPRSEEHTSELQSLMRISYAVFCLKTKKKTHQLTYNRHVSTTTRRTTFQLTKT